MRTLFPDVSAYDPSLFWAVLVTEADAKENGHQQQRQSQPQPLRHGIIEVDWDSPLTHQTLQQRQQGSMYAQNRTPIVILRRIMEDHGTKLPFNFKWSGKSFLKVLQGLN